jgi:F-type H+-transporting ATPase subunit alpha
MVEVLKQGPFSPLSAEKQVAIIFAGNEGFLDGFDASNVVRYESELYPFIEASHPEIFENIRSASKVDDDTKALLKKALEEFTASFVAN